MIFIIKQKKFKLEIECCGRKKRGDKFFDLIRCVSGKDLAEDLIKGLRGRVCCGQIGQKRPRASEAIADTLEPLEQSLWALVQGFRVY